jgi:hypothetical protein
LRRLAHDDAPSLRGKGDHEEAERAAVEREWRATVNLERLQLEYLAKSHRPLWGGHLKRGERITSPEMQRWLDSGWIETVGTEGYRITDKGREALQQTPGA